MRAAMTRRVMLYYLLWLLNVVNESDLHYILTVLFITHKRKIIDSGENYWRDLGIQLKIMRHDATVMFSSRVFLSFVRRPCLDFPDRLICCKKIIFMGITKNNQSHIICLFISSLVRLTTLLRWTMLQQTSTLSLSTFLPPICSQ